MDIVMDIIYRGQKIMEQLGLAYRWRDSTGEFLDIIDPTTEESTCHRSYDAAILLDFLMKTGKLRLDSDDAEPTVAEPTSKDALLAQVEELNRLAESFGNSVSLYSSKLCYWRHRHPINPKDKASPRIFTTKDALDPKRRHRDFWWYFDYDEITELRRTILHDRAIYIKYFPIKD